MNRRLTQGFLLALPLLAAGPHAVAADAANPIPQASTERFLGKVPDFAGGKPSPNIIYSTRAVGEAANAPGATSSGSPAVSVIDSRRNSQPLSSSRLSGGTLERRQITPEPIRPTPITPQTIQPYSVTSPWSQ